ncbi:MAG: hypothetical protein HYY50_02670 [Candidatus Kerfeldbacteria bacterium]|nr:hypothetical protein [Candidatus Kerfeldbacteria bacterium]
MKHTSIGVAISLAALAVFAFATAASANHSWGPPYHWARTSNPFTLKVGDNVSSSWDFYLDTAIADWSQSSVLDMTKVAGGTRPKTCRPTAGRVESCSARYGNTGWLGIAQIWITGGEHITQGVVKVNDYYFSQPYYNTAGWRSLVMCQEPGHTLGLGHQDENFNNDPIQPHTCMDYFIPEANEIVHPNQHDYEQLEDIYSHLDTTTTISQAATSPRSWQSAQAPREWGREIHRSPDGQASVFVRDLGLGRRIVTHVFWAE